VTLHRPSLPALLFALLALSAQLVFAAAPPRAEPMPRGEHLLCHDEDDVDESAPQPQEQPHHHAPDCVICPLCVALNAAPAALLSTAPALPPPRAAQIARAAVLPPATAPPVRGRLSAQPRAPPSQT
jgi:hypothetical protein